MKKIILFFFLFSFGLTAFGQWNHTKKKMWAKSIIHRMAPELDSLEWVTEIPDTRGKFVLVDFWATGCVPCKKAIPELNEWSKRFKKDLVVIGVALQKTEQLKAFTQVPIEYYSAAQPGRSMLKVLEMTGIPHVLLIDPNGIVRWEGYPLLEEDRLTAEVIEEIIKKYPLQDKRFSMKPVLNQKAPALDSLEWVTKKPRTKGKFVLVDFWATGCVPCKKTIPKLNEWSKQFKKDLVIIGIALQKTEQLRAFTELPIEYYSAANPKRNMRKQLGITGVPYVLLIDPSGIVRWEGFPLQRGYELTTEVIEEVIKKYK